MLYCYNLFCWRLLVVGWMFGLFYWLLWISFNFYFTFNYFYICCMEFADDSMLSYYPYFYSILNFYLLSLLSLLYLLSLIYLYPLTLSYYYFNYPHNLFYSLFIQYFELLSFIFYLMFLTLLHISVNYSFSCLRTL